MKYYDAEKGEQTAASSSTSLRMNNPKIIFNDDSKVIVGGVSLMMRLPPGVSTVTYTGCVDGLQINHHFVGSWNSEFSQPASVS